ncbi:MAG TPA: PQQ-binding-like beta-propeller repeat protein [Steroidobacteraceae bacterium]
MPGAPMRNLSDAVQLATKAVAAVLPSVAAATLLSVSAGAQAQRQSQAQGLFDTGPVSFSAMQADRGKLAYNDNCSSCHGGNLDDGQFGPPVKGPAFRAQWHAQSPLSLLAFMATKMPPSGPGGLDNQAYADIEAYILQQNGEQPGPTELAGAQIPARGAAEVAAGQGPNMGRAFVPLTNQDDFYRMVEQRRHDELQALTPVTDQMLRQPAPGDWLMWRGTYGSLGYTPLRQINRRTVHDLRVAWTLSLPVSANEITPLVHDGVLFVESANTIEALDGASGTLLWQYVRQLPEGLHGGRDGRIKSMAIYEDRLIAPTVDGHIVALNVHTGQLVWDQDIITPAEGMHAGEVDGVAYHMSGGPIIAHGRIVIGVSLGINIAGGDFIVGLDAQSGKELWRFHTIARPGERGADSWNGAPVTQRYGSGVWTVGSYDPDLNLVYFGTGNTYDVGTLLQEPHKGQSNDALFTDSTLALDPDTGKLAWYYQHFNADVWDLDWVFEQSLITLPIQGKPTPLLVTGGKLAIFDALDRASGKYEFSKDAGLQNLVASIDPVTGRKIIDPKFTPTSQGGRTDFVCPSTQGARNWIATSIDPTSDILYVPLFENCMKYSWVKRSPAEVAAGGNDIRGATVPVANSDGKFGRIEAIDLKTRKIVWTYRQRAGMSSSLLVSAGGLLFSGSHDRVFRAYDAASGKPLWQTTLNASPNSTPVSYSAGGQQYVAVVTGGGGPLDGGVGVMTPEIQSPSGGTTLWVFTLNGANAH